MTQFGQKVIIYTSPSLRVKLVEHGMHFCLEELERGRSKIGADDKGEKREMIRNLAFVNWPPTS